MTCQTGVAHLQSVSRNKMLCSHDLLRRPPIFLQPAPSSNPAHSRQIVHFFYGAHLSSNAPKLGADVANLATCLVASCPSSAHRKNGGDFKWLPNISLRQRFGSRARDDFSQ